MNDEAIAELVATLREARNSVEDWAAYADRYFVEKWDLAGDLARIDAVIAKYEVAPQMLSDDLAP